jgi:putative colanic acid biosysnthesis UDP-glucose lipid carrier transferase
MNDPVVLKRSIPIAAIALLQSVLPAAIIPTTLILIARYQEVAFDQSLLTLASVSVALSLLILQRPRSDTEGLKFHLIGMTTDLLLRWLVLLGFLLILGYVTGLTNSYARQVLVPWAVIAPMLVLLVLVCLHWMMRETVLAPENRRSSVIVGCNDTSISLAHRLVDHPELCMRVIGMFDDRSAERLGGLGAFKLLGKLTELAAYVRTNKIDVIFVALPVRHIQRVQDLLDDLRDSTASIYYVPDLFVFDLIQSRTMNFMGVPVVAMCETPFYGYRGIVKRLTDIALTTAILILAFPVMFVIAVLVKLTSRGPAIFRQSRYGLDGKEIKVYKFRTMFVTENGTEVAQARKDDPRVTALGAVLRRYSLDELPQLINVLQGRMSLVGPRPHAVAHNEQYRRLIKGYMIRHKVRPGITGLAQVNGCRGETAELSQMESRVRYDLDYLRHWSPTLDLKILILTAFKVFFDKKAY